MTLLLSRTGPHKGPVLCSLLLFTILGIRIGSDIEDVRSRLDRLAIDVPREREEEREGRKEAWLLRGTEYKSIALQTNPAGKVVWVTGFVRPGREIPFSRLGKPARAIRYTENEAIWNVRGASGAYRLVAKGQNRKASVIYLLSLIEGAVD